MAKACLGRHFGSAERLAAEPVDGVLALHAAKRTEAYSEVGCDCRLR